MRGAPATPASTISSRPTLAQARRPPAQRHRRVRPWIATVPLEGDGARAAGALGTHHHGEALAEALGRRRRRASRAARRPACRRPAPRRRRTPARGRCRRPTRTAARGSRRRRTRAATSPPPPRPRRCRRARAGRRRRSSGARGRDGGCATWKTWPGADGDAGRAVLEAGIAVDGERPEERAVGGVVLELVPGAVGDPDRAVRVDGDAARAGQARPGRRRTRPRRRCAGTSRRRRRPRRGRCPCPRRTRCRRARPRRPAATRAARGRRRTWRTRRGSAVGGPARDARVPGGLGDHDACRPARRRSPIGEESSSSRSSSKSASLLGVADDAHDLAVGRELRDAVRVGVGDVDVAVGVDRDAARAQELALLVAAGAEGADRVLGLRGGGREREQPRTAQATTARLTAAPTPAACP